MPEIHTSLLPVTWHVEYMVLRVVCLFVDKGRAGICTCVELKLCGQLWRMGGDSVTCRLFHTLQSAVESERRFTTACKDYWSSVLCRLSFVQDPCLQLGRVSLLLCSTF